MLRTFGGRKGGFGIDRRWLCKRAVVGFQLKRIPGEWLKGSRRVSDVGGHEGAVEDAVEVLAYS